MYVFRFQCLWRACVSFFAVQTFSGLTLNEKNNINEQKRKIKEKLRLLAENRVNFYFLQMIMLTK